MKKLLLLVVFIFYNPVFGQEPLADTPEEKVVRSGYVVVVATEREHPRVQEQFDIFENSRQFFADRNIQPYLITPRNVESFFNQDNERFLTFGNYQKLQDRNSDFYIIVLDEDFNTKYRTEQPLKPTAISEVLED